MILAEDLDVLNPQSFIPYIADAIRSQCEAFSAAAIDDELETQLEHFPPPSGFEQVDEMRIVIKVKKSLIIFHISY
jgi:hypothetical protein